MKQLIFLFVIALFAITAFAQPDPNVVGDPGFQKGLQPQPPLQQWNAVDSNRIRDMVLDGALNQSEVLLELTDSGIFIYKAGILVKLDYANLKVQQRIEFFGPLPVKPVAPVQPPINMGLGLDKDSLKYIDEVNKRIAPATIIDDEDSLLFLIGNTFIKVNQTTMNIDPSKSFAKKVDENGVNQPDPLSNLKMLLGNGNGGMNPNMPVNQQAKVTITKIKDNTLVFLKQDEIIEIDTLTGNVIARNTLPPGFTQKPFNYQQIFNLVQMLSNQGRMNQPIQPGIKPGIQQPDPGQVFPQPGVKMPGNNNINRQPPNNPPANNGILTEKDMTVLVGTVLIKNGLPILRCEAGEEYLLAGPKTAELIDKTKLNNKYRLMGKISRDKIPPFGIGYFDVYSYKELNGV